MSSVNRQLSA